MIIITPTKGTCTQEFYYQRFVQVVWNTTVVLEEKPSLTSICNVVAERMR